MITASPVGTHLLLTVAVSRLDAAVAVKFREEAIRCLSEGERPLILDFSEVTFLDSSGLGALVSIIKRASRRERPIICGLQPAVRTMFALTRMDQVFVIRASLDEAVPSRDQ